MTRQRLLGVSGASWYSASSAFSSPTNDCHFQFSRRSSSIWLSASTRSTACWCMRRPGLRSPLLCGAFGCSSSTDYRQAGKQVGGQRVRGRLT